MKIKKVMISIALAIMFLTIAGIGTIAHDNPDNDHPNIQSITFLHFAHGKDPQILFEGEDLGDKPIQTYYNFISKDAKWKTTEEYYINPTNNDGLSEGDIVSAITSAISEWESYTPDIFGEYISSTDKSGLNEDGENIIYFGDYPVGGVIAVCRIYGTLNGPRQYREIIEFDIMFDTDFTWGNADIDSSVMDLENIATHELGHAVGLGDIYQDWCTEQTMYGFSSEGETKKRTLEFGDIAGIQALYSAS